MDCWKGNGRDKVNDGQSRNAERPTSNLERSMSRLLTIEGWLAIERK